MNSINISVFASGNGSNAENMVNYFKTHPEISVSKIFSNNPDAFVLKRAEKLGVSAVSFTREEFYSTSFLEKLKQTDYIVLAGFLWLIPNHIIIAFKKKIINIHPSLLPNFGGKGMYGRKVHEAVIDSGVRKSGITIHLVNEKYDDGAVLFQAMCLVDSGDSPDSLATKIHKLEYEYLPKVVRDYILR